jgi:hypothetical protein
VTIVLSPVGLRRRPLPAGLAGGPHAEAYAAIGVASGGLAR